MRNFAFDLANRRATRSYIDQNPVVISLKTQVINRTTNGGTSLTSGPDRPPQRFTLVPQGIGTVEQIGVQKTADGEQLLTQYVLIGESDAQIARYDYWLDEKGLKYEVTYIYPENGYERRALVVKHG